MSSTIPNARLIGTAKPNPSAPTSAVAIAVVIPINSPLLFNKAPPLEPLVTVSYTHLTLPTNREV